MKIKLFVQRHAVIIYFIATFTISWLSAFIIVAPEIINGLPVSKMDGILMFPVMILGPALTGIILTVITESKAGLLTLWASMTRWKVSGKWYLFAFLITPGLILMVLLLLKIIIGPEFIPNFFPFGLLFGIPAGILEEIGWTGFAYPKMRLKGSLTRTGIILGVIWGLWHLPVIDFLGAASPHGKNWLPFAFSFIAAMAAVRMIIVWVYSKTNSVLMAQLIHIISTGSLVLLGPAKVSAGEEAVWYASYAVVLWITVLFIYSVDKTNISKAAVGDICACTKK